MINTESQVGDGCDSVPRGRGPIVPVAIKHLCTTEIVAYHISARNDNELVLETFKAAFEAQKDATGQLPGLIVHSDQGFQYTSHAYHDMLPTVGAYVAYRFLRGIEEFFLHGIRPSEWICCLDNNIFILNEFLSFFQKPRFFN
ncbi:DDE-type integrase/transposase/recombinase [Paenibacillus ginsengarvi]|uniref:Transposase n=1 Tax=Paenibacillus ginsengarvi TaxID=400777 RepID=A0A3B0AMM4_9BACL|nr:DDE-type integrase/transposase/recombinase [Paenibacillus ginsengarvi]RKN61940.1 transposase [Paenibacillus ginsengarvi]